jgi:putative flavoprotein involved in K+ transport
VSTPALPMAGSTTRESSQPRLGSERSAGRSTEQIDVLVVGAGQAGLSVGYYLRSSGMGIALVDRHGRVGDSWRERYDSLALFTPRAYSALPGLELPGDPRGYPSKDEIADYLEAFAATFDLPVRLGVDVRTLETVDGLFVANMGDGSAVEARAVVIAAGAYQAPRIPALASGFSSAIQQLSSSTYRNPSGVNDGTVLVVGDGATGRQIAHELSADHRVLLSHGRSRRVTRDRILGRSVFWWLDRLGLLRVSRDSAIGRRLRRADPFPGRGHDAPALLRAGVRLVPRLVEARGESARFENGLEEQIAAVVWSTGYRDDASWVHIPGAADTNGSFIEADGASPVPGMFFVGRSWQSSRGSALLFGVGRDAEAIAESVRRSFATPRPLR